MSREIPASERNEFLHARADSPGGIAAAGLNASALEGDVASAERATHLEYWRGQLAGEWSRVQLPYDRARASAERHSFAVERFTLPPKLAHSLKHLSRQSGFALFVSFWRESPRCCSAILAKKR